MRVLAVLYCYPPLLVPAAVCYAKLMEGLVAAGAEVEILTISPHSFASPGAPILMDQALAAKVAGRATHHQVRSPENSLWLRAIKRLDASRAVSHRWLEPKKREWTFPAMRYLQGQDLGRFDVLLTCSQPHANHLLGLSLQARTRLPWVAYFSDPWTDSPYMQFPSPRVREYNRLLEDRVLGGADLVLFTCAEMRDLVQQNHPALAPTRSGLLPHAFVPEWYADGAARAGGSPEGPVRLLQTGSFYGPRTPMPLIESLQRVGSQVPLAGRLQIDSFGDMDDKYRHIIAQAGLTGVFNIHGYVPYLQTLAMMKQYDGLLLVDAPLTTAAESVFLPSKLVDYLGASTPTVAVTPKLGATARVVREVGGIVCPLEDPAALDDFLLGVVRERHVRWFPRAEQIAQFDYRTVGKSLICMMEQCARQTR